MSKGKLLVVIDLQKGWRHSSTEPAMLQTVKLCHKFPGDIIHCCFKNDPTSLFYKQIHWRRFIKASDTDEIPEVVGLKLPVYWRSTYSCVNEETLPLFKRYKHVYIAGVFTDISVFVTALDIFDQNIPVSVVVDCIGTLHGPSVQRESLRSLDSALGTDHLVESPSLLK